MRAAVIELAVEPGAPMSSEGGWTDERVDLLKKLWAEGISASSIARQMGGFAGCGDGGRSAVIGKVHRLGLSGRKRMPQVRLSGETRRATRKGGNGHIAKSLREKVKQARTSEPAVVKGELPPPSVVDFEIPVEQRRTIETLEYGDCRWPVGDPQAANFFFCGGEAAQLPGGAPGSKQSYCAAHHARARIQRAYRRITPLW